MRTKNFLKHLFLGALLLSVGKVGGQSTVPGNAGIATDFLGWDNTGTNNFPLMVRHDLNQPIDWYTNAIQRMRLNPSVTTAMGPSDAFPNVNRDGYLLLSGVPAAFTDPQCRAPFTRLHLVDQQVSTGPNNYAQQQGFRPWQRNGITLTGNNDQSYIGHRYDAVDNTDLVFQWSDNPASSPWGTDRLKFVFTTLYNAGFDRGAASMNGLEAMRLWPKNNLEVNVGIGDFYAGNLLNPTVVEDPTERLDMLDGRLRIRQLPSDSAAVDSFYVMVVDRTALTASNQERGVVKWVHPDSIGGADCDWTVVQDPTWQHAVTAYAGNPGCPQWPDGVGIGVNWPKAKLHVNFDNHHVAFTGDVTLSQLIGERPGRAIRGEARTPASTGFLFSGFTGVLGTADNAEYSHGVIGLATNGSQSGGVALDVVGVQGVARAYDNSVRCVGVLGKAGGAWVDPNWGFGNDWAGWFDGNVYSPYGVWTMSDSDMKQDVAGLTDASSILGQLQPKTYSFNADEYGHLGLEPGMHMGLMAEEVAEVLPHAVRNVIRPAEVDSTGEVVNEQLEYQTINYQEFIPLLIAGYKEQQTALSAMQAQLAQLQEQLAACCANPTAPADGKAAGSEQGTLQGDARNLLISPNPFNEATTLTFVLEREGRAQLLVNSADGKHLRSLFEGQRTAGEHRYEWSTADLSPGIYYVTLLFEGQPLVKKAVKVAR